MIVQIVIIILDHEATVSGCSQNLCTLSDEDALSGTRILIEREDGFISIGGPNKENMDGSERIYFNVDQIRNITFDEKFFKTNHKSK